MINTTLTPFLKWPGGKRWLVQQNIDIFHGSFNHYYEPFIGGGAVYFSLLPEQATIADINEEVINLYKVMRDNPLDLRQYMEQHQQLHCKDYYYSIRSMDYTNCIERAARVLYMNRTCYNGIYRVNKNGKFNVPIGTKDNCIYDIDLFERYSQALKGAKIVSKDFGCTIRSATEGDLIFADPPYASMRSQESFIKYNDRLFTWADQERLLTALVSARDRGARIILTNANYRELIEMYTECGFIVKTIERPSTIAGKSSNRGVVKELLITS